MIGRLKEDGYLSVNGRSITLTPSGRNQAESVVRKHRLAERLLTDVIGLEWHRSHMEATRWEHVISDEVEARLIAILGNPATCPHGNPIPGSGAPEIPLARLSDSNVGQTVRLERVTEQVEFDYESLAYLGEQHFVPGVEALVTDKAGDGTITLDVEGRKFAISADLSRLLFVAA